MNDGVIKKIGRSSRLGRYVVLQDVYGNRFTYAHLGSISTQYPVPKEEAGNAKQHAQAISAQRREAQPRRIRRPPARRLEARPHAQEARRALARDDPAEGAPVRPPGPPERARVAGGEDQILASKGSLEGFTTFRNYFSRAFGLNAKDVRLKTHARRARASSAARSSAASAGPSRARPRTSTSRSARSAAAPRASTRSRSSTAGSCSRRPRSTAPPARTPSTARTAPRSARSCCCRSRCSRSACSPTSGSSSTPAAARTSSPARSTGACSPRSRSSPSAASARRSPRSGAATASTRRRATSPTTRPATRSTSPRSTASRSSATRSRAASPTRPSTCCSSSRARCSPTRSSRCSRRAARRTRWATTHDHIHVGFRPLFGANEKQGMQALAILKPGQWDDLIGAPGRDRQPAGPDQDLEVRDPGQEAARQRRSPGRIAHFSFVQFEFGHLLGPPDGRYLRRDGPEAPARRVVVLRTLGAPQRRLLGAAADGRSRARSPSPCRRRARRSWTRSRSSSPDEGERWIEMPEATRRGGRGRHARAELRPAGPPGGGRRPVSARRRARARARGATRVRRRRSGRRRALRPRDRAAAGAAEAQARRGARAPGAAGRDPRRPERRSWSARSCCCARGSTWTPDARARLRSRRASRSRPCSASSTRSTPLRSGPSGTGWAAPQTRPSTATCPRRTRPPSGRGRRDGGGRRQREAASPPAAG